MKINSIALLLLSVWLVACQGNGVNAPSDTNITGKGGSMARFAIAGDYLYTIAGENLGLFDISDAARPQVAKSILLGANVETIFPYQDKLFFGTTTGMLIYDNARPLTPQYISRFDHITSCDPVVVEGTYAYVTLRSGMRCNRGANRLDIVDLTDIAAPKLVVSYDMYNPHGLGIDNGTLFVCDGDAGLKVYDASDPKSLTVKATYRSINAYDVIPDQNLLIMTGESGIYQYDYTDSVRFISKIVVEP
jgi:hypothetical protein